MKLPKENYFEVFVTNIQRQTIGPNIISHEKTLLCVKYWNVYYIEIFACCRCCYRSDRGPDHLLSYNRQDYNCTIDIFDCQEGPSTKNDNKNYKISPKIVPILDKNFKCQPHDHVLRSLFFQLNEVKECHRSSSKGINLLVVYNFVTKNATLET